MNKTAIGGFCSSLSSVLVIAPFEFFWRVFLKDDFPTILLPDAILQRSLKLQGILTRKLIRQDCEVLVLMFPIRPEANMSGSGRITVASKFEAAQAWIAPPAFDRFPVLWPQGQPAVQHSLCFAPPALESCNLRRGL
jgi:hypothetical protein